MGGGDGGMGNGYGYGAGMGCGGAMQGGNNLAMEADLYRAEVGLVEEMYRAAVVTDGGSGAEVAMVWEPGGAPGGQTLGHAGYAGGITWATAVHALGVGSPSVLPLACTGPCVWMGGGLSMVVAAGDHIWGPERRAEAETVVGAEEEETEVAAMRGGWCQQPTQLGGGG